MVCGSAGLLPPLAHACTVPTEKELRSQRIECWHNLILPKCILGPQKRRIWIWIIWPYVHQQSSLKRHNVESSSEENMASKSAIKCQSITSWQSPAIKSKHNHLIFHTPQIPATACLHSSFLCPWCDDISLCIHTILAYHYQPQHAFQVNCVVVRLIMNIWCKGVQLTKYSAQNLNLSD